MGNAAVLEKLSVFDNLEFSRKNGTQVNRIPCCNSLLEKVSQTFLLPPSSKDRTVTRITIYIEL